MNKGLYEKYGKYFLNKFEKDDKLKFDVVKNNSDGFGVYIYSKSDFSEYFLRIDRNMIYVDGIVVQDEGLEFQDISAVDSSKIYLYLDTQAEILTNFLKNGVIMFAYQNADKVVSMSTNVTDRKKLFENFDIEEFYNEQTTPKEPDFERLTKIELLDFYGDVVYEYSQTK